MVEGPERATPGLPPAATSSEFEPEQPFVWPQKESVAHPIFSLAQHAQTGGTGIDKHGSAVGEGQSATAREGTQALAKGSLSIRGVVGEDHEIAEPTSKSPKTSALPT